MTPGASRPITEMMCESRTAVRSPANGKAARHAAIAVHPDFGVADQRRVETRRHHADDGEDDAVEDERLADGVAGAAEEALPQAVAEHGDRLRARAIVVRASTSGRSAPARRAS